MDQLIQNAVAYVEGFFARDCSGHDAEHTLRVWRLARAIAGTEVADARVVELAALLHDVDDRKISPDTWAEKANAVAFMKANGSGEDIIRHVVEIIGAMSFAGDGASVPPTPEGKIVQDADRLDAMGAIGIARTFAFGGSRGRKIYDPAQQPDMHMSREEYAKSESTSINHFFEKLLRLRDLMNTNEGRRLAEERHRFMETYLDEFFAEWSGLR